MASSAPVPIAALPQAGELVPSRSASLLLFAVIFALGILVYLGTTGTLPLVGRDEPRYVEIGREMLRSGDWITPRLGGFTWFEKPVLLYWMVAGAFEIFGVNEWAARLGPALCGLGSAALLWWMVRPTSERVALWSALALLCSGGMLVFAHGATFDIVLTCSLTLALGAWWKAHVEPQNARKFLALFWGGIGLAFLSKGLVAFVLPLGTIGLYALARGERVKTGFWWGLPLALLVSSVWYGPMIAVNGAKFVNEFFVQHHFERFVSDKFKHHQPFWYYLGIMPLLALPWTPFLVVELWKTRLTQLRLASPEADLKAFALAWMLVPLVFFSLSGSKLPGYILPALPGAALLAALAIARWTQTQKRERFVLGTVGGLLLLTAILTTIRPVVARAEKKSVRGLFQSADKQGLGKMRVVNYGTISRPAQFYAASQLVYGKDGEPACLTTARQVQDMEHTGPFLLLVPKQNLSELKQMHNETIADNGTTALVLVRR